MFWNFSFDSILKNLATDWQYAIFNGGMFDLIYSEMVLSIKLVKNKCTHLQDQQVIE